MYARGVGIVDPKSPWGQQNFNNSQLDKTCFIHLSWVIKNVSNGGGTI